MKDEMSDKFLKCTNISILFQIIKHLLQFNIFVFNQNNFFVKFCNKYCQLAVVHIITMTASPLGAKCLLPRNLILMTDVILKIEMSKFS